MPRNQLVFIWVVLFTLLALRFFFVFTDKPAYKRGEKISFTAMLFTQPQVVGNTQRFVVNGVSIVTARFPAYHYADGLLISGVVSEAKFSKKENGVLGKKEQDSVLFFPKIELEKSDKAAALAVISDIRQHIMRIIQHVLPTSSAALLSGIVLGAREDFSRDFYEALRNTGTLHVVAASGMNVSLVASFVMAILLRIVRRPIAAIFVIVTIIFYAFIALLQPSIVRAAIMGGIAFGASTLNRQTFALWSLIVAAFLMLLFDPKLLFDVGFQLSFAATAGLLLLKPAIENAWAWFHTIGKVAILGDSFTTTLVAQAATFPILLANFGTVSIVSIVVNTLILWVVQPIMALGIVAAILSIVPYLATIPIIATLPLLTFFESVVRFFNRPEFLFSFEVPFLAALGYYCLLIGMYFVLKKRGIKQ